MTITCLNCGHVLGGRFCESCGQRAGLHPVTLRGLLQQVSKALFDVDRGVWHTLIGLLRRPGEVINGYLDGRRIRYTNPFALFLLFSGINAVLFTSGLLDLSYVSAGGSAGVRELAADMTRWGFQYYSLSLVLSLPLAGAITRWCFAVGGRNYAEHLVINAYIAAELAVYFTCLFPLLLGMNPFWFTVAWNGSLLLSCSYNIFALVKVFGAAAVPIKALPRAIAAVALFYFITWLVVTVPIAVYAYRNGLLSK